MGEPSKGKSRGSDKGTRGVCRGIKCATMNKRDAIFWVPLILHSNRGSYFVED
ncbi:hypothetical protein RHMOL_Rhmol09G0097300 [Rhododendron molle]|uniref:Uncharacterized protein n=1 Tax=Rhododendron molle TaxID=49168 RepID=A0ACC0MBE3_RHOML|nr:hypothetical protein RHMOL_Rhmol09G0097300 [Rhododendron molle]